MILTPPEGNTVTATRLLLLGSIRELGTAHGYQVRRDLESRGVHIWAKIQQGSIYHGLKQLHRDELISVHETKEAPSGPARTEYSITPAGERAFFKLIEHALRSHEGDIATTIAGVGFMTELTRSRVIELLRERVTAFTRWRAEVVDVYETTEGDWEHHIEAIRLWAHVADNAIAWTQDLIGRLEAGEYVMSGESAS